MTESYDLRPEPVNWTPPSGPDVALLTKTLDLITEHAQRSDDHAGEWNQEAWLSRPLSEAPDTVAVVEWDCGTAACMAGHVVVGDGVPVVWDVDQASRVYADYVVTSHLDETTRAALDHDDDEMTPDRAWKVRAVCGVDDVASIETYARTRLGLTTEQANRLFGPSNGLWTLWALVHDFTDGAVQIPASVVPTPDDLWKGHGYNALKRHGYDPAEMRRTQELGGTFQIIRVDQS